MIFTEYLTPDRIVFLKSQQKDEAFSELADLLCSEAAALDKDTVMANVWERERLATTKLAPGIALPHAKIEHIASPIIVVGISHKGIVYESGDTDPVHLMIMIISDPARYLPVLSSIAAQLNEKAVYEKIVSSNSVHDVFEILTNVYTPSEMNAAETGLCKTMMRYACQIYKEADAHALVVYADAVDSIDVLLDECGGEKVYIITGMRDKYQYLEKRVNVTVVQVPFGNLSRSGQIEMGHLFITAKNLVKKNYRVISVYGKKNSGLFDTIFISHIEKEYADYFPAESDMLPADLHEEVFARAVQLLGDLAAEGREGKAVGTIFILADHEEVLPYCQQMVINPFKGIDEEERNILDPSLEETIKEFSKMDGAFVIRGDGVLIASGAYISTHMPNAQLLRGLGARHAAAASITSASKAIALVLSESTRKISFFRAGKRFMVI
ncbi:MAG: PTS sugar transporter subunit IIA [Spirochaetales bacterium]|nr:PTS sugar transporter subunit IIA [Spirochaetales bacterium]